MSLRGAKPAGRGKALFQFLVVALGVAVWVYFSIKADYRWVENVISEKQQEGWVAASTTANVADPIRPWTFFRPSVTRIAFVRSNDVFWIAEDRPAYKVLWVDRDLGQDTFVHVANCRTGESAFVAGDKVPARLPRELDWRPSEPGTPGLEVVQAVCEGRVFGFPLGSRR